ANVHENVKAQGRADVKCAQSFVVAAAMAQAQLDDLGDAGFGEVGDKVANLAVGVVAGGVEQRRGQFDFESLGTLDQIDDGRVGDGQVAENFGGGLGEVGTGLEFVVVGLGVLDQRGRGAHLAGKQV